MTALIIIGIIVLLVAVLLILPVNLVIEYKTGSRLFYDIDFLFLNLKSNDKQKKNKKLKIGKSAEPKKTDIIAALKTIVSCFEDIKAILKHLKINELCLNCICGGDAAHAAIKYGSVCALAYPFAAFIKENSKNKKSPDISVSADFDSASDFIEFKTKLHASLIFALIAYINIKPVYDKACERKNKDERE